MTPPPHSEAASKAYVYLLRSLKDKKFYLGWTTDLKRRLDAHNQGLNPSTKGRRPFVMVGYEAFENKETAKNRERVLKRNPNMLLNFKKKTINCASLRSKNEVVG